MNESTPSKHNGGTLSVVKADSGNDNRHKYCKYFEITINQK